MLNTSPSRFRYAGSRYSLGIAVCIIAALLALPLFIGSAVSPIRPIDNDNNVQSAIPANSHSTVAASTFNFLNPLLRPLDQRSKHSQAIAPHRRAFSIFRMRI